nr:MAG TPA: hypothetical protein [Caudoviricetes sp.]
MQKSEVFSLSLFLFLRSWLKMPGRYDNPALIWS